MRLGSIFNREIEREKFGEPFGDFKKYQRIQRHDVLPPAGSTMQWRRGPLRPQVLQSLIELPGTVQSWGLSRRVNAISDTLVFKSGWNCRQSDPRAEKKNKEKRDYCSSFCGHAGESREMPHFRRVLAPRRHPEVWSRLWRFGHGNPALGLLDWSVGVVNGCVTLTGRNGCVTLTERRQCAVGRDGMGV